MLFSRELLIGEHYIMGTKSFVTLYDGRRFTIDREKGDAMLRVLHGLEEPKDQAQADYVLNIKSIYPALRTADLTAEQAKDAYWADLDEKKAHKASIEAGEHLTNTGIEQGMYSAIPKGDR